jgi:5-methyltetrahydropteroyltriglutamate--homocysteine methyltransferase
MALAHTLGLPRTGYGFQLKKAKDAFKKGDLDEPGLREVGRNLRAAHWQAQKDAGIELLPVGDFAWCDAVHTHSLMFGVIPEHLRHSAKSKPTLRTLLEPVTVISGSACGATSAPLTAKWFDTDYHYQVPPFTADQTFELSWDQLFEEVEEATALGHRVKPVLIGPLTYLWLGKINGASFDTLDLLERLLPVYCQVFRRLAEQGIEWVQIDEPILVLDLPQDWRTAFERVYNLLQREPLRKLVATYFGSLEANLGLAATLPVDGLHVDLAHALDQYPTVLDRMPAYKVLSLGLIDAHNASQDDLHKALAVAEHASSRLGDRLWLAPSCPQLQGFMDTQHEKPLDAEWLCDWTFALRQCQQVAALAKAINEPIELAPTLAEQRGDMPERRADTCIRRLGRQHA